MSTRFTNRNELHFKMKFSRIQCHDVTYTRGNNILSSFPTSYPLGQFPIYVPLPQFHYHNRTFLGQPRPPTRSGRQWWLSYQQYGKGQHLWSTFISGTKLLSSPDLYPTRYAHFLDHANLPTSYLGGPTQPLINSLKIAATRQI